MAYKCKTHVLNILCTMIFFLKLMPARRAGTYASRAIKRK